MKKLLKILAVFLGATALLAVGLTVFIKVKYPPEKLTALVNEQARKHLNREVRLASVSVGLVRGVALDGFELSEAPDFAAGRFIASRSLSVKPFLLPLLKGRIVIKSIDLVEPEIRVVRFPDNRFNFSDLTGETAAPTAAPAGRPGGEKPAAPATTPVAAKKPSSAPALFVNRLTIARGSILYEDRSPAKTALKVTSVDLDVRAFSLTAPFSLDTACVLDGRVKDKPLSGKVAFQGTLSLTGVGEARVERLAVEVLKTSLALKGFVKNFADPQIDVTLAIKSFDPAFVAPFAPLPPALADLALSGELAVKGGLADVSVQGPLKVAAAGVKTDLSLDVAVRGALSDPAVRAVVAFSNLNVAGSALLPDVSVEGPLDGEIRADGTLKAVSVTATVDGDNAVVKHGSLATKEKSGALRLSVKSRLETPFANPSFEAQGKIEKLVLAAGPPLPPEVKFQGPVSVTFSTKGTAKAFSADATLDGDAAEIRYGSLAAKEAGVPMRVAVKADLKEPYDNPAFQAEGRIDRLALGSGAPLPADLKLGGPASVKFTARGTAAHLNFTLALSAIDVALAYGATFAKPAGAPFTASLAGALKAKKDLDLAAAEIVVGPAALNARGRVADLAGDGRMDISVKAAPFALDSLAEMAPMIKEYGLTGRAGIDAAVQGTFAAPKYRGTLTLAGLGAVPMKGLTFSDLSGSVAFTEDSVETDDLRGKFNGSDLALKARARDFARPTVWCDGWLAQLDAGALMNAFRAPAGGAPGGAKPAPAGNAPPPPSGGSGHPPAAGGPAPLDRAEGAFRVDSVVHPNFLGRDASLAWDLANAGPDLRQCDGTAEFRVANGKVHDIPIAEKVNKLLKKDATDIPFTKMSAHFTITKGVLETQDLSVGGPLADILVKGTVDMITLAADLRAVFKLPKDAVGGSLGEWFTDEDGRPTLEATMKSPLTAPHFAVDLTKAAKKAAEDLLKKGIEKLKGGEDGNAAGETPSKSDQTVEKVLDKGQKAFDKLFKKR